MRRYPYFFLLNFCTVWLMCQVIYGTSVEPMRFDPSLRIGKLCVSGDTLSYKEETFNIYELEGEQFIPLTTLMKMGVSFNEKDTTLYIQQECEAKSDYIVPYLQPYNEQDSSVYLSPKDVVIGGIHTYSIQVGESVMVPLEALKALFDVEKFGTLYNVHSKVYQEPTFLYVEKDVIYNTSEYTLYCNYIDMYWDGENFIDVCSKDQILLPYSEYKLQLKTQIDNKPVIYLGTYIESVQDLQMSLPEDYGQRPIKLYKSYTKAKRIRELEQIFVKFKVTVKINYKVAGFEMGEEVQLWRSEKRQYHVLLRKDGKKVNVPWGSITILGNNGQGWKEATQNQLEDYVNLKDYESETDYLLWTDLFRQRTYVFKGSKNNWELIKTMKCSTGTDKSLTPSGIFIVQYKIPYFGMEKGYRCKNGSVIFRDYMYHSILFDKTGEYVKEGLYQLGSRVSHGCIRLSEPDSEWIYENIPEKTKVYVE